MRFLGFAECRKIAVKHISGGAWAGGCLYNFRSFFFFCFLVVLGFFILISFLGWYWVFILRLNAFYGVCFVFWGYSAGFVFVLIWYNVC